MEELSISIECFINQLFLVYSPLRLAGRDISLVGMSTPSQMPTIVDP